MDSVFFVAENSPPPIPPPLPEPVPPPILCREEGSPLWRLNDRLAWVAGGLTLILLGVIGGRVFGPDAGTDGDGELVAAVAPVSAESQPLLPAEATAEYSFSGAVTEEEVNPPELVVTQVSAQPRPEVSASLPVAVSSPVPQPAAPSAVAQEASALRETAAEPAETIPSPVAIVSSPVSFEGKIPTIKLPANTQVCGLEKKAADRKLNTALTWAESVSEASQRAEEEKKLLFLIHVSGNFEIPGFT